MMEGSRPTRPSSRAMPVVQLWKSIGKERVEEVDEAEEEGEKKRSRKRNIEKAESNVV